LIYGGLASDIQTIYFLCGKNSSQPNQEFHSKAITFLTASRKPTQRVYISLMDVTGSANDLSKVNHSALISCIIDIFDFNFTAF